MMMKLSNLFAVVSALGVTAAEGSNQHASFGGRRNLPFSAKHAAPIHPQWSAAPSSKEAVLGIPRGGDLGSVVSTDTAINLLIAFEFLQGVTIWLSPEGVLDQWKVKLPQKGSKKGLTLLQKTTFAASGVHLMAICLAHLALKNGLSSSAVIASVSAVYAANSLAWLSGDIPGKLGWPKGQWLFYFALSVVLPAAHLFGGVSTDVTSMVEKFYAGIMAVNAALGVLAPKTFFKIGGLEVDDKDPVMGLAANNVIWFIASAATAMTLLVFYPDMASNKIIGYSIVPWTCLSILNVWNENASKLLPDSTSRVVFAAILVAFVAAILM